PGDEATGPVASRTQVARAQKARCWRCGHAAPATFAQRVLDRSARMARSGVLTLGQLTSSFRRLGSPRRGGSGAPLPTRSGDHRADVHELTRVREGTESAASANAVDLRHDVAGDDVHASGRDVARSCVAGKERDEARTTCVRGKAGIRRDLDDAAVQRNHDRLAAGDVRHLDRSVAALHDPAVVEEPVRRRPTDECPPNASGCVRLRTDQSGWIDREDGARLDSRLLRLSRHPQRNEDRTHRGHYDDYEYAPHLSPVSSLVTRDTAHNPKYGRPRQAAGLDRL